MVRNSTITLTVRFFVTLLIILRRSCNITLIVNFNIFSCKSTLKFTILHFFHSLIENNNLDYLERVTHSLFWPSLQFSSIDVVTIKRSTVYFLLLILNAFIFFQQYFVNTAIINLSRPSNCQTAVQNE